MNNIHASDKRACTTADTYMKWAKQAIDNEFGVGFAAKNPALIAAHMAAASSDVSCVLISDAIGLAGNDIANALNELRQRAE